MPRQASDNPKVVAAQARGRASEALRAASRAKPSGLGAKPGKPTKTLRGADRKLTREVRGSVSAPAPRIRGAGAKPPATKVDLGSAMKAAGAAVGRAKLTPTPTHAGLDGIIGGVLHTIKQAASGTGAGLAGHATSSGSATTAALSKHQRQADASLVKNAVDGTTQVMRQLTRPASATAGAANAAADGKGVGGIVKGAVHGAVHNDQSFTTLAKKAGLHGIAAEVVGLGGDILLDPTTYASFGLSAPAKAAEASALAAHASQYARAAKPLLKAVEAGDRTAQARLDKITADLHARLDAKLTKAAAKEGTTRGIQAGIRTPRVRGTGRGGRQIRTSGRTTAAIGKRTAPLVKKITDTPAVNQALRAFKHDIPPKGMTRKEWNAYRASKREANALGDLHVRKLNQLGIALKRGLGGDPARYAAVIHAIEGGTIHNLPAAERKLAQRWVDASRSIAVDYEKQTGKPLRLHDLILADGDLKRAADTVASHVSAAAGAADKAVRHAAASERTAAAKVIPRVASQDRKLTVALAKDAGKDGAHADAQLARDHLHAVKRHNAATAELRAARKGYGNAARMPNQASYDAAELTAKVARLHAAEQAVAATKAKLDETTAALSRAGDKHATAKAAGQPHDARLARLGRAPQDGLQRAAARTAEAQARAGRLKVALDHLAVRATPVSVAGERAQVAQLRQLVDRLPVSGKTAALDGAVKRLEARVAFEPPVDHVPRLHVHEQAAFETAGKRESAAAGAGRANAAAGFEKSRLDRRRLADQPDHPHSMDAPIMAAHQGIEAGQRLSSVALFKAIRDNHAIPLTEDTLKAHPDHVLFSVDDHGRLTRLDKKAARAAIVDAREARAAGRAGAGDHVLVPAPIADDVAGAAKKPKGAIGEGYDTAMRAFKTINTVGRPGFYGTTLVGNAYIQWLRDTGDFSRSLRILHGLRSDRAAATGRLGTLSPTARKIVDRLIPDRFLIDGKHVTLSQIMDEAQRAGAIHVGSRAADPAELSAAHLSRRAVVGGAPTRTLEGMGNLAEDFDDATKLTMYIHARSRLGMSTRDATDFVYRGMPNYADLSDFERSVMKRVMPFYVYTSRNLPIQVKSLIARPGKAANVEKVRQHLASVAGLRPGWETSLAETDQERFPVPVPGVHASGNQLYSFTRTPLDDVARAAQLAEGPAGALRIAQRYAGDLAPPIKAAPELLLNNRFDFNRPIYGPDATPPEAGTLLRALGATTKHNPIDPKTGKPYKGAPPVLDYAIRGAFGSPGSLVLSAGKTKPDASGVKYRALVSYLAGQGVGAPDPRMTTLVTLAVQRDKARRDAQNAGDWHGKNSVAKVKADRKLAAIEAKMTKLRAQIGYPYAKEQQAKNDLSKLRNPVELPADLVALQRRMRAIGSLTPGG